MDAWCLLETCAAEWGISPMGIYRDWTPSQLSFWLVRLNTRREIQNTLSGGGQEAEDLQFALDMGMV